MHRFACNGFCSPPSSFFHDFRPAHVQQRCYAAEIHTSAPPLRSPFVSSLQLRSVHQRSLRSLLLLVFFILGRFFLFPAVELWVSCHFELKCCILDREDEDDVFCWCVVVVIILFLAFFPVSFYCSVVMVVCHFVLQCRILDRENEGDQLNSRIKSQSWEIIVTNERTNEQRDYSEGDMGYRSMWLSAYMGLESFSFLTTKFANEMQSWEVSAMDDVLQRGFLENPCVCDLIWISCCWNKFRVLIFTLRMPQRTWLKHVGKTVESCGR